MPNPYSIGGNYTKKVNPYSVGGNYTDTKKKDEIKEKDKEKDKKVNPNPFDKKLEPNKYQIYQDNEKHKDNLLLELDKLYYEYDKDDKFVKAKYYLENADKLGITNPEETFKTGMFTDSPSDAGEEFIKKYDKETYENMKYNYNQLQEVLKDYDSGNKNGISNQGIQIYNERVKMRNNLLSDTNKSTSERDNKQPDTNHQKEDKTSSEGINRVQTGISIGENKVNNSKTFNPLTNPNDEEVSILEGNYNAKDNQIKNSIEPPEDNDVVLEPEPDEEAESTYVPDVDSLRYQDKFDIIGKNTAKSESTAVDTGVKEEVLYHEDNKRVLKTKREEEFKLLEPFNQLVMDNLVYNNDTGRLQMKEGVKINDVYRQLDSLRNEVLYKMGWDPSDYNFFQREAINTTDDWIVDDYDGTLRYASEEFQMQSPGMGSGVRKHLGAIGDMFNDKDIPENVKKIIAEINGLQQIVKNKKWEEFASQSDLNPYTPDIDEILEKKAKGEDSIFSWDNVVESAKAGLYNAYATTFNMATVQGTKSGSERLRDEQELLANYYVEVTNMNYEPPPAEVQDMIVEIGLKNIKERYRKADGTTIEDATAIAEYDEIINAMRMNPEIYKKNIEQMNQLQQEIEEFLIKSHEVGITSSRSNEMFDALSSEAMKLISFSEQVGSMAVQLATTYPLGYSMAGMVGKGFMRGGNLIKNVPKVQKILNANGGIAKMYNRLGKGLSFTNSVLNPSYGYGNRVLWSSKDYMPNMLHSAAGMGAGAAIGKTLQHDYNDTYYDILKEGKNYALFGFFGGGLSNLYNRIGANKLARVIGTSNKYSQNGILTNAGKAKIAKNYLLANTVGDFVGSPLSTVWEEIVTGEAGGIDKLKWEDYMFEGLFDIILGIREMPGTASRAFGLGQDIKRSDIYGEKITINSNYMSKIPIEVNDTGGMRAENPNAYTNRYTAPYENIENIVEDYKISNKEKFNKEDIRVKDILDATDSKILSKNEKELLRNNFGDIKINAFNNELKTQVAKYDEKTGEISLANNGRLYNRIDEESITNDDIIDAITHELAHSQTVEELKNNPNGELAKEIKGIADNFKKRYKDDKSFRKRVNKDESAKELADALNLFDREVDVLELTAILSQKDSPLHKHLDIKPSKMAKLMGKKDKHRTEFFYNIFAKPVEHKEPKDIKITKPTTDQNINKQKETVSDVNVESDIKNQNDVFLDNIALPNHIIDKKLSNKNKSKRLASSNEDNIRINPVENVQEFYDYFEGKVEGETSNQKKEVLNRLADKGYPLEKIKKILNDVQSINTFLLLHEHSHIVNKDIAVYWKNGKNLLTEDKIQIETRATINALDSIEDAKREEDEFAGLDPKDFEDDYDDTIDADKIDDDNEHFADAKYFENGINKRLKVVDALTNLFTPKNTSKALKSDLPTQPDRLTIRLNTPDKPYIEDNLTKLLGGKGVPKEQIDLMFDYMKKNNIKEMSTEDLAIEMASKYNHAIKIREIDANKQRYGNMTVKGGVGYQELNINIPSIKIKEQPHANFSDAILHIRTDYELTDPNNLRIQELQSDLFQDRDNNDYVELPEVKDLPIEFMHNDNKDIEKIEKEKKEQRLEQNKFLNLLGKNNNWITFGIKTVLQYAKRNSFTHVSFPKGDTAAKVEGHETLEEYTQRNQNEIRELEKENNELLKLLKQYELNDFNKLRLIDNINELPNDIESIKIMHEYGVKSEYVKENGKWYQIINWEKEFEEDTGYAIEEVAEELMIDDYNKAITWNSGIVFNNNGIINKIPSSPKDEIDNNIIINELQITTKKKEISDAESGKIKLSKIANYYEETITNILNKHYSDRVEEYTDDYGNKWNKVRTNAKDKDPILYANADYFNRKGINTSVQGAKKITDALRNFRLKSKDVEDVANATKPFSLLMRDYLVDNPDKDINAKNFIEYLNTKTEDAQPKEIELTKQQQIILNDINDKVLEERNKRKYHFDHKSDKIEIDMQNLISTLNYSNKEKMYKALTNEGIRINSPLKVIRDALQNKLNDRIKYGNIELSDNELKTHKQTILTAALSYKNLTPYRSITVNMENDKIKGIKSYGREFKNKDKKDLPSKIDNIPVFYSAMQNTVNRLVTNGQNANAPVHTDANNIINELMDPSNISEVSIIIDNDGNEIELNNRFKDENSIPLINELMKNGYYLLPKERGGIALYSPTLFQIAQNDPNKLSTIKKSLYNTLVHAALNSDFAKYNTDLFKNKRLKELYDDMGSIIDFEHIVKNNYKPDRISNFGLVGPEKREGIKEKAKKIASVPADKELITNWAINTAKTLMTDFNSNGETLTNNISIGSLVSGYVSSAIMPGMENYFFKKKDDKVFFKKMWTKYINMMTNDTPMRIQSINDFEALFPEYTTNGKIDDKKLRKLIYDPKNNTIKKRVLVIPHSLFEGDKMYENLNEFSHDGNSYVIDEQYIGIHRRMLADNDADVMVTKTHSFQTNKDGTLEQKTQHQYYNTQRFDDGTEDAGSLINRLKDVNASEIVFETAMKNKTPYRLKEVPTLIDNKNVILQVNNGGEIVAAKDENGEQIIGDDLKRFSEWTKEQVIAGNPPKHLFNEIDVTGKEGETMLSVAHVNDRLSNTVVPLFDIPAYSDINSDVWSGNNELYHKMRQIPDRIFEDKVEPLVKAISSFTNKQETDRQYLIKFIENFADKIKNSNANNEYVDTFGREEAIRRLERAVNNPDMLTNEINNLRMFGEGIFFNKKAIQPKRDIGGNILYNNDGSIIYKVNEKDLFNGTMAHKMLIQAVEDAAKVRVTTATFVGVPMMDKFAPEAAISLEGQLEYNRVFREEIENLKLDYNAGNITKEHFEEQKLVIDKIATQAKLSKQKDIGTKVNQLRETYYTNGSRLPDSKAPVIYISKKDYRILKQRDPSFTIGSKIFAKRTPIDSPASMLPVIVGGVLDGEGIMSIDKDIYAGFWGADFDKDAVQLILSDKYFDKVLYEEFWNHLSDMDLNQYNNKSASDYFNDIKSTYYGAGNKFTDKYALRAKESPKISPLLAHHNTSAFKSFIQQGSAINYRNTLAGIAETGKLQEVFPKIPYRMNSIKVGDKIHNVNEMDAIIGILSEAGVDYSDKNPFTPAELIEDHLYEFAKKEGIVARGKALGPMEKGPEERKLVLMELNQKLGTQKKGLFANKAKLKVPKDAPKYDTHMNRIYDRLASIMPDINSVGTEYLKEVNELKADILQNFDNDKRNSDIIFKKALNDIGLDNRYADLLSLSYLNNTLAIIQQARYKPTAQSNYSIKKEYNTDIFDKTNDKTEQKNIDIQNELALSDTEVHPKEKFMVATDLFGAMFINAPYLEINKLITDKMGGHTTTVPSLMHSNDNLKKRTLGSVYHHMAKVLGGREGGLPLMKQKIDGKNNVIYLEPNTGDIGHYVFSDNIKNYTRDNRAKILINVKDIFDSDGKINNKMNEEIMGTTLFKVIFPPESKANTIPLINQKQDYIIANKPTVLLNQNIINKNIISDIAQKSIEEHIRFANDLIPDNIDKSKVTNEIRGQYLYGKNKGVNASNKNVNRSLVFNLNHNLVNPFGLIQKVGIGATYGGKRVKTLLDNNEEHFALSSFFSNKFRERRNKRATLHNVASFLKGDELDYFMTTYGTNASDDKKDSQIQDKLLKQVNKHIKKLGLPIKETDKMYDDLLKAISPGAFNITEKKLLELEANNDNNNLIEMRAIRPVILYEIAKTLDNMSKDAKYKKGWLSNLIQYRMFDSRIPRAVYESIAQDYTYFDPEVVISSNYVYNNGKPAQNTDIDRNKTSIKLKHITDPKSLENSEILSNPIKNDFTPMDLVDRELMIRNMSGLHSKAVIKYVQPLFLINHDKDVLSEKLYDMKKVMYSITSDFNKDIKFNSLRKALGGNFSETLDKLIKIETRYDGIEANPNSNTITLLTTNESFDIKDPIKLQKEISKVLADKYGIQNQRAMSEAMVYITFKAYQNTILNVMSSFRDKTSNILNNLVDPTLSMDAMKKDPKAHGIYGLLNKAIDNVNSYINEISNITPDNYYKLFRERLAKDKDIADIYDMTMDITQSESILSLEELYHEKKNAIVDKYGGLTDYNKMDNPDIIQVLHNPYVEGLMQENNDAGSIDDFDNKSKEYLYNLFGNIEQRRKNLNKQEEKLYSDDKIENKDKKAKEIEYRLNNLNKFEEQLKQKIEEYGGKEQLIDEILTDAKKYAIISAENGGVYYNILNKLHIPGYERDFVELNGQERKHYDGLAKDIIKSKLEQEVTPYKRVKVHYDKASERIYHTKEGIKTSNEIYEKVDINDIIEALSPNSHRNNFFEGSPGVLDEKANVILKNSQINIENAMRHDYKYYKSDNFVADAIMNDMLSMTSGSQYIYDKEYDPGLLADNSIKKGMPIDIITRNNKDDMFTESIQGRWGGIIEVTGNAMLESIIGDNDLKEATTEMVIIYDDVSNNGQLHLIPKNNIRNIQTGRTYSRALPDLVEKRRQKMYDKAFSEIRKELNNIEFKSNEYKVRNIIGGMTIKDGKAFKPKIGKTIVHSNTVKNNIQDNLISSIYDVKIDSNKGLLSWMNDLQKNNSKWVGMSLYLGLGNLGLMVGGMATANPIMMGVAGVDMIRKILYHSVYRNRMGTGAINTVYDIQAETDRTGFFRLSSSVLNSFMESFANASNRNTSQTGISTLQNILKGSQHARTTLVDVLDTDISRGPSTKNVRKKGIQGSLTTARLSSSQELMNYHLSKYNKASELKQAIERYNRMLESGNYDGLPGIKEIINQQLNKYKKLELKEIGGHIDEKGNKVPVKIGVYDSKYGININKIDGLENYDYGTLFTNIAGIWGSLGGFFQRQEAHSAGTVFIKAGNMFERLHQAKDNKGVTMNAAFRAELEKQFLYKTIGNYERAGGTRTSFGRVLTMFGNYGHENFLNQTFYRKKRADLYKAIYDTMSEDKEFINYLGKAGLSVGAFYLPKNNIVSAVALSSSFKILQFLTTLGAAAMFDDETEELTDKTFNKIGSNFTRGVGFLVGDIVQPIKIFPAMLTMMDQATTVFKKPEMDMRKQTKQTNTIKYAPWDYTGAMGMGYGQSAIFNATFTNGLMIAKTAWDRTYSKRASDKDKEEFFPQFVMNNTALLNFIYGPASLTTQAQKGFLEEYMKGDKKSKHISK